MWAVLERSNLIPPQISADPPLAENDMLYYAGRIFQVMGLIALPSAIWVGHFGHNERGSIAIFLASILVFVIGTVLIKLSNKVQ